VPSTFSYDPETYWPTGVIHGTNGAVLTLAYSYFDEGNVKAITDGRPGMSVDLTNGYDPVDRLVHAVGPWGALTYDYDAVGNRIGQTTGNQATTYQYDAAGHSRLVTTKIGGLVTEGFWHNDLGQLVVDGRGVYTYTPSGLLDTAQMGSGLAVTHRYDADGMRAVKITGGVPHYYVHGPGGQLLAEYEEAGGQLVWDVDYLYAGSRLLAAVRPDVSYTVSVTKAGTGSGTVTTDPPGLDCGATCSAPFAAERSLTLTAVPAQGSGFIGWSGACAGTSPTITLTVTSAAACTATFSSSAMLVVTASGSGSGTVGFSPAGTSCGTGCATFAPNTQVTLSATPAGDAVFSGWAGDPDCIPDGHVTMDRAKGCTAVFTRRVGLTVTKGGSGSGTVTSEPAGITCGPTCVGAFAVGSVVMLTATPGTGSTFAGWSGDCTSEGATLLSAAKSCTAIFNVPPSYTLTVQKTGSGSAGSTVTSTPSGITCGATCSASYTSGTSVQLTAVAASGFRFVGWQGTGCTTGTVTMTGALTCTAVFQALPCDPDGSLHQICQTLGGTWNSATCSCSHVNQDPLLLTLDGGALALTDLAHGVRFDADGDGATEPIAWTTAGTQVGFLALDLNGNGVIDTGAELFGGPPSGPIRGRVPTDVENGFTRLAAYDTPAQGGNGDGVISAADAVFGRLRVPSRPQGLLRPLLGGQTVRAERWSRR
jgi:YD repeat-containing protein